MFIKLITLQTKIAVQYNFGSAFIILGYYHFEGEDGSSSGQHSWIEILCIFKS